MPLEPKIYEIDGLELKQYKSFKVYENTWYLNQERKRKEKAQEGQRYLLEVEEKLGKSYGEATHEELNPYMDKMLELNAAITDGNDVRDLVMRARVDLAKAAKDGLYYADDEELKKLESVQRSPANLKAPIKLLEEPIVIELADRLYESLLASTHEKIIKFYAMELEEVDDPSKLSEEWQEAAEPNPKAQESESQTASKPSTAKSKRKPKATTKSKAAASQIPATTTATTAA